MLHRRRGQSLIEIMVVISIIGLLTSVTAVAVFGFMADARVSSTRIAMSNVDKAVLGFYARRGRVPTTAEGLEACRDFLPDHALPLDAWDHPLQYAAPGPGGRAYVLFSLGADGEPGGDGEAADLSSENPSSPD